MQQGKKITDFTDIELMTLSLTIGRTLQQKQKELEIVNGEIERRVDIELQKTKDLKD